MAQTKPQVNFFHKIKKKTHLTWKHKEKAMEKKDFEAEYFQLLDRISELLKKNNPSLSGTYFVKRES